MPLPELPHYKLLLWRLKAQVPASAGPRGVLGSLRMRLALKVLFWFVLAVLQLTFADFIQSYPLIDSAIIFAANWMVYATAICTAVDLLFTGSPPPHGDAEVSWFAANLSSSNVVLSLVLGSLSTALPIAIAILFYSWVRQVFFLDTYPGMTTWLEWLNASALYILRIPQLVLFGICLTLAVRRTALVHSAPWLLAAAACLAAEAMGSGGMPYVDVIARDPFRWPGSPSFYSIALGVVGLCWLASVSLRRAARIELGGWQAFGTLLLWCGLPLLLGALIIGEGWSGLGLFPPDFRPFAIAHAFLATFLPDVSSFWFYSDSGVMFYGWTFSHFTGWLLAGLAYFASLGFWWLTARQCLDGARNMPRRYNPPPPR